MDREPNVDTDAIIPKQFLKSIKRSAASARTCSTSGATWTMASQGMDPAKRVPNPNFVLNLPRYRGREASCLPARTSAAAPPVSTRPGPCMDFGFRAVVAPSYADIFFNNSFKNGLLPVIQLPAERGRRACSMEVGGDAGLPAHHRSGERSRSASRPTAPNRPSTSPWMPFRQAIACIEGLDEIGLTLQALGQVIREYEDRRKATQPWLYV